MTFWMVRLCIHCYSLQVVVNPIPPLDLQSRCLTWRVRGSRLWMKRLWCNFKRLEEVWLVKKMANYDDQPLTPSTASEN